MTTETRFWSKVRIRTDDECWLWQAGRNTYGYGRFRFQGLQTQAHRVAWLFTHGPPGDKHVLHTCDNAQCVNPHHLYLGTRSDNMRDMWERSGRCAAGERNPAAKLTYRAVQDIRDRLAHKESRRLVAQDYGISLSTIGKIAIGQLWRNGE